MLWSLMSRIWRVPVSYRPLRLLTTAQFSMKARAYFLINLSPSEFWNEFGSTDVHFCRYILTFATALESTVFGLQKKPRPPRMCRIYRTFRKSYPFGVHAATNRPKSTLNVPAFLDFWLTGYRCSGRFLWMSGHFWNRSGVGFRNFGSRPLKIQSLKYKIAENPWLSPVQKLKIPNHRF